MIYNQKDILQAYSTGKGGIVIRGQAEIEEAKSGSVSDRDHRRFPTR